MGTGLLRRLLVYAAIGVVLTYGVVAVCALLAPVIMHSYGVGIARIHRYDRMPTTSSRPASAPSGRSLWVRIRTWVSPYGTYFQIHRTRPWQRRHLPWYFPESFLQSLTPAQIQDLLEHPKAEAAAIPRWSVLRADWPRSLGRIESLMHQNAMWYEVHMGWPIECLRGVYVTRGGRGPFTWLESHGVIPVRRTLRWPRGGTSSAIVGLPLVPDGWAFAASVAFYAGASWLLVVAYGVVRHALRRRRGLCPRCGYDLRASPERCPECGWWATRVRRAGG